MALLVSVMLFGFFWIIGFALLIMLYRRNDLVRMILISPAVGVLVTVYANYGLSRLGLLINQIALSLGMILLTAAVVTIIWRRPPMSARKTLPYLIMVTVAFLASGWPLITIGFPWLAAFNPDAANYILDTARLVQQPYIAAPDAAAWVNQTNWSSYYVTFPLNGIRTGSDLLFAWAVTVTGLDEPALYMPVIVALHVAALCAATALIGTAHRFARLLSGFLLAVTALSSVGVTLQLLGQELGLMCLGLTAVLLLNPFYRLSTATLGRFVVLAGFAMATFILCYPEMIPFLGLGFLMYHGISFRELRRFWWRASIAGLAVAVLAGVLIAPDLWNMLNFLVTQLLSGTGAALPGGKADLFPYFLIPSGVSALWGLNSYLPGSTRGDIGNLTTILGFLFSGATLIGAFLMLRRPEPCAVILIVMAMLGATLVAENLGFGVFKLAMYAQPFLMTTAVLSLCRLLQVER